MSDDRDIEGVLRDHWQTCDECDGNGHVIDDPESGETDECYECRGDGQMRWGSWYTADTDIECADCGEIRDCGCMAEDRWYVCFDCYVAHHKKICGCDLWRKWEAK